MARKNRHLQIWIDACKQEDLEYEARWVAEHRIQFDPDVDWRRVGGRFELLHNTTNGGFVVLMPSVAGWFIGDAWGRTFAPRNPLPPEFEGRARRHDKRVYFDSEATAKLAAECLAGYWINPAGERT